MCTCPCLHATAVAAVLCCSAQTFGEGSQKVKVYHHYAYRMEAAPPFRICGVSQEIKLVMRKRPDNKKAKDWTHQRIWKDTSQTAYISGLYLDGTTVQMSYGSSDIDARLLSMDIQDMETLFDGSWDCSKSDVVDAGSGEQLPQSLQDAATSAIMGPATDGASSSADGSLLQDAKAGVMRGSSVAATVAAAGSGGFGGIGSWSLSRKTEYLKHAKHRRSHHRDHRNQ